MQITTSQFIPFPEFKWLKSGISEKADGGMSWSGMAPDEVVRNRKEYLARQNLDILKAVSADQTHGTRIQVVSESDASRGMTNAAERFPETDGFITRDPGVILTTLHADCAPVFFACEQPRVIGLAHAGWQGILNGLPGLMVEALKSKFACELHHIRVAVGPMISQDFYPVHPDRAEMFIRRYGSQTVQQRDHGSFLDLTGALFCNLLEAGLVPAQFASRPPCTFSNSIYASYRRDGENSRSMMAWLTII